MVTAAARVIVVTREKPAPGESLAKAIKPAWTSMRRLAPPMIRIMQPGRAALRAAAGTLELGARGMLFSLRHQLTPGDHTVIGHTVTHARMRIVCSCGCDIWV